LDLRENFEIFLLRLNAPLGRNLRSSQQTGGILRCIVTNSPAFSGMVTRFSIYISPKKYRVLFVIDRDIIVSFSIGTHGIVSK